MSGKIKIGALVVTSALVVLAGIILVMNADAQKGKGWPAPNAKARFISGATVTGIPNKIVNDIEGLYYENVGNNTISMGPSFVVSIYTDRSSSRYVNLYFDDVVSGPGQNLPSGCAKPYFIYPQIIAPITTTHLYMKGDGEFEMIVDPEPDPNEPNYREYRELRPKENSTLNFDNMTEGESTITYATWFYFYVPDLKSTKGTNENKVLYAFADCQWVKVTASDFYGERANRWIFEPISEPFKLRPAGWKPDDPGQKYNWVYYHEGSIPHVLYSNASLSCDHGTYRMPWQLEIVRTQ